MSTREKLNVALKDAMKAHQPLRKTTLRMALAEIKNAEIKNGRQLDEPEVLGILQKEVKSRHEAIADAKKAGRPDLESTARQEIAVLEVFLPRPLTPDELAKLVQDAITETGASSPRDMGQVMRILMPRVKGRADGKVVSGLVQQALKG